MKWILFLVVQVLLVLGESEYWLLPFTLLFIYLFLKGIFKGLQCLFKTENHLQASKTTSPTLKAMLSSQPNYVGLYVCNANWQPNSQVNSGIIEFKSRGIDGTLVIQEKNSYFYYQSGGKKNQLVFDNLNLLFLQNGLGFKSLNNVYFVIGKLDLIQITEKVRNKLALTEWSHIEKDEKYFEKKYRVISSRVYKPTTLVCEQPEKLKSISHYEKGISFEINCDAYLRNNGYVTSLTKKSGDFGVDIIASRNGEKLAIQCKNWESKVGSRAIQEVVAGRTHYGCNRAVVVSKLGFTKAAQELAKSNNVVLCTPEEMYRI